MAFHGSLLFVSIIAAALFFVVPSGSVLTWSEHEPADSTAVGAHVFTCSGCRLNQLHALRDFIKQELTNSYPSVEVHYVLMHDPVLRIVNRYQQTLAEFQMASMEVEKLREVLRSYGITSETPAPVFLDMEFPQVGECLAWRQTSLCMADGPRERAKDQPCDVPVGSGRSGYCLCTGGVRVAFSCDHEGLLCADECEKQLGNSADL